MSIFLQILFTIIILGSLYTLVTVGFTVIYSVAKVLHVAHGVVTLLGAYLFLTGVNAGVHPLVAAVAALVACGLLGLITNALIFERLRRHGRVSSVGALIASVALLVMGSNLLQLMFGPQTRTITGWAEVPRWNIAGAILNAIELGTVALSVITVCGLILLLKFTRFGQALRAVADHTTVAEVVGINARRMRHLAFMLGSTLAGLAGVLFALRVGLEPNQSVLLGLKGFFRAVIGGVGSIPGAIAGNLILETAENVGAFYFNSAFKEIFSFLAIFAFLLIRPQGLFGHRPS